METDYSKYIEGNPDMGYKREIAADQENRDPVLIHVNQSFDQLSEQYGDKPQYKNLLNELAVQIGIIDASLAKQTPDDVSDNVNKAIKLIEEIKTLDKSKHEIQ